MNEKNKLSPKIYNESQINAYMDMGCTANKIGRTYNDKKSSYYWYIQFLIDETYKIAKIKWRRYER